jgi:hypothetical protein
MINPSANGWIDKYFLEQNTFVLNRNVNPELFYLNTRKTGFIYGHIVSFDTNETINKEHWLQDEVSKVALLTSLSKVFCLIDANANTDRFIKKTVAFYDKMNPKGFNLFKKMLPEDSDSINLEKIIDNRVQTNIDIISKNFSNNVTNALLFIDVMAFQHYLYFDEIPEKYLKKMEETVTSVISLALKTKTTKTKHDDLLIKLFESSVRYSKFSNVEVKNLEDLKLDTFSNDLEKYYLIDLAGMALWSDGVIEKSEAFFLHKLAGLMSITDAFVNDSICDTNDFILKYKKEIPYFNYSNPVKHFYDQTTQNVEVLITRNKKRLYKELSESKELMVLLAKSTHRDLDEKEKKKVKKQLLDICKTVPSLTVFMLPGGSLLLPILIKFIPKLLPSAFNENLENE